MDDEAKKLLRENLETSRKILKTVHKMQRMLWWQKTFRIIKWGVIIIFMIIGYQQIQPYLGSIYLLYQNFGGILDLIKNLPDVLQTIIQKP